MRKRLEEGKFGRLLLLGLAAAILLAVSGLPTAACTIWISGLSGNVAGGNISGTNVSVQAYLTKAPKLNADFNTSVNLGASNNFNAGGYPFCHVATVSPAGQAKIRTNGSGNWMSSTSKGTIAFSTLISSNTNDGDGTNGTLGAQMVWTGGGAYIVYSTGIQNITLYNKALCLADPNLTSDYAFQSASVAFNDMIAVGHTSDYDGDAGEQSILSSIPIHTLFYTYTCGAYDSQTGITSFADCNYGLNNDWDYAAHAITSTEVATAVGNKTSSQPDYNFAFINAGDSAIDDDMAIAFGVTGINDRAYLGWDGGVDDSQDVQDWNYYFWQQLLGGSSAHTIDAALAWCANNGYDPAVWNSGGGLPQVYGDGDTTLHYVYHWNQ
jgi:hypothetical protein